MAVPRFAPLIDVPLGIGESPLWDQSAACLWFIDMEAPAIHSWSPGDAKLRSFAAPSTVCAIGLATANRLVVALRDGIHLFDPATGAYELVATVETDRQGNRPNDGCVGPDGAFWIGTMCEEQPYRPTGALYRVAPDGKVRTIRQGLHIANGLAWSPDGATLYYADSVVLEIRCCDVDHVTGSVSADRRFAELEQQSGHPDGAAVDSDGCYWSAGVTAGRLNRLSPQGRLIDSIPVPVDAPTMPCFGAADLQTLFVTSLTTDKQGASATGSLIGAHVPVAGRLPWRFGA